jgi:hypothetical protein
MSKPRKPELLITANVKVLNGPIVRQIAVVPVGSNDVGRSLTTNIASPIDATFRISSLSSFVLPFSCSNPLEQPFLNPPPLLTSHASKMSSSFSTFVTRA